MYVLHKVPKKVKSPCPHCKKKISLGYWKDHTQGCLHNPELKESIEDWFTEFYKKHDRSPFSSEYKIKAVDVEWPGIKRVMSFYKTDWSNIGHVMLGTSSDEDVDVDYRIRECVEEIKKMHISLGGDGSAPTFTIYKNQGGPHSNWLRQLGYNSFLSDHVPELKILSRNESIATNKRVAGAQSFQNDDSLPKGLVVLQDVERYLGMPCRRREKMIWNWSTRKDEEVIARELI